MCNDGGFSQYRNIHRMKVFMRWTRRKKGDSKNRGEEKRETVSRKVK